MEAQDFPPFWFAFLWVLILFRLLKKHQINFFLQFLINLFQGTRMWGHLSPFLQTLKTNSHSMNTKSQIKHTFFISYIFNINMKYLHVHTCYTKNRVRVHEVFVYGAYSSLKILTIKELLSTIHFISIVGIFFSYEYEYIVIFNANLVDHAFMQILSRCVGGGITR